MTNETNNNPETEAVVAETSTDDATGAVNIFPQIEIREDSQSAEIPDEISLLPLRDAVLYPKMVAPIVIGREPYIKLIDESIVGGNRVIGVVTQRDASNENPGPGDIYPTGVAVAIRMMSKGKDAVRLFVEGAKRFQILQVLQTEPYIRARVKLIEEPEITDAEVGVEIEALKRQLGQTFGKIVDLSPDMPDELKQITEIDAASIMTDLMAAHVGRLSTAEKVEILETIPLKERMEKLLALFIRESQVLELGVNLQNQVAGEMGKAQRDYFLREQMKAIQKELGEGDERGQETEELRKKIDAAGLPEDALKEANREFDRLQRMSPGAPEYTVSRSYIDLIVALPWNVSSEDNLDIAAVKQVLDEDHYGLEKVKDRILEYLSVRKFKKEGTARQPILCLVGPPGVGKTSLGKSIARALGKKFFRLSLGGVRDEAEIRGHRRTYLGAMPGQILQGLKRAEVNNPLFMLDEIDKVSADFRGDPSSALLEVLDPEQNNTFRDNYLDIPFDLSKALFVCTANQLDTIQGPLRDRMEIIEIAGYTEEEKVAIARQHLVPKQIDEHGLSAETQISFTDDGLRTLVRGFTREAGVRNLEREIASVCRKATRAFAEGRTEPVVVDAKQVVAYLGAPRFEFEEVEERTGEPGVVTGLVWTPVGGDVIFIEAQKMEGSKHIQLTGQLGSVMQESVHTALSYVRSHASDFGIDPKFWNETEIHVHVPAGAIPKDGPSAGVTMATAITSLLTGRPVKPALAMTGEMTLTGKVLPIGGVKEKVLAAKRAGIKTIILPERNRKDLDEDIPVELRAGMTFLFARTITDVLANALEAPLKPQRIKVVDAGDGVRERIVPGSMPAAIVDGPLNDSLSIVPPAAA